MRPFFVRSAVCVVPLRSGGGTGLKILEAMAMQRPVVSTSIGAEGINVEDNRDIVLTDNPESFAESVIKILQDENKWKTLTGNGRKLL